MENITNLIREVEEMESQTMDIVYQDVIDMIQSTPAKNDGNFQCAFFLACAIKECMKHKDSKHLDKAYIWEKVSKAMSSLELPISYR